MTRQGHTVIYFIIVLHAAEHIPEVDQSYTFILGAGPALVS